MPRSLPCTHCRYVHLPLSFGFYTDDTTARHLKCHGPPEKCQRCQSLSLDCHRSRPVHFRSSSNLRFSPDQVWLPPVFGTLGRRGSAARWRWVDETHDVMANVWLNQDEHHDNDIIDSPADNDGSPITPEIDTQHPCHSFSREQRNPTHAEPDPSPSVDHGRLTAILLRYFTEEVAARFDLCDPERHFTQLVPSRARACAPLRHAILTTAARHLIRLQRHRNTAGVVEWQGHALPDLTEAVALAYHTACITDLLALSMDPDQIHNDNLLAAAIILRTDEEMDAPLRENPEDQEVFLRMLNVFISAQVPHDAALPHSSSPSSSCSSDPPNGLRQAAFWVALRQEVFTSFIKQRPLSFPLSYCDAFRTMSPATDAVWADRLIIFCADVLEYCYGSQDVAPAAQSASPHRWHELVDYQDRLHACLPASFDPLYVRPPDPDGGQVFPEIWHLDPCHVTGTTHSELSRLLLLVFDPTRPRLGPGSAAQHRATIDNVRAIVLRLCGMALSNRQSAPTFIEALMGITTCGEYFELPKEQQAILGVLEVMRLEHAFPTQRVEDRLMVAWR